MPVYNVLMPVVECVEAPDGEAAETMLAAVLSAAGFQVYDGGLDPESVGTFEAEAGTEPSVRDGRVVR